MFRVRCGEVSGLHAFGGEAGGVEGVDGGKSPYCVLFIIEPGCFEDGWRGESEGRESEGEEGEEEGGDLHRCEACDACLRWGLEVRGGR